MIPCLFVMLSGLPVAASQEVEVPRKEVGAFIATIHSYELQYGRNVETWQRLQAARGQVFDPLFAIPPLPGWLNHAYVAVLQWFHLILILVILVGMWVAWKLWAQRSTWKTLGWCVMWFAMLFGLYEAIATDNHGLVVIKTDGTILRQGNGVSYPPHIDQGLPIRLAAGVEAVVRTRRNNAWVQVTLPGGKVGWVPVDAVYLIE